jgi:tricorn protease
MQKSYLYQPSLGNDKIFFIAENSLWSVSIEGGIAKRLVTGEGVTSKPMLSPDGNLIAFNFNEEGSTELYIMPSEGGTAQRLTYHNRPSTPAGWSNDSKTIYFASTMKSQFNRTPELFSIAVDGGTISPLNIGSFHWINIHPDGNKTVLGKNRTDLSYWKRYKGGTAGQVWYGTINDLKFSQLIKHQAGHVMPQFVGDRIYFLSDRDGISNIYSINLDGEDLKKHTDHKDFYVRNLYVRDGKAVYQLGGEIYLIDLKTDQSIKIEIDLASPLTPDKPYFTLTDKYIEDMDISDDSEHSLFTVRGKLSELPNWSGASKVLGKKQGVRYRLAKYINDDGDIICASDEGGEERIELHHSTYLKEREVLATLPAGRIKRIYPSNEGKKAVVISSQGVYYILDIDKKTLEQFDKTESIFIDYFQTWSPDDRYIAYTKVKGKDDTSSIFIYDTQEKEVIRITDDEFNDRNPEFDPEGKYLYFVSLRYMEPYIDHRDIVFSYQKSSKPYIVILNKETPLPFLVPHKPEEPTKKKNDKNNNNDDKEEKKVETKIDKDGIIDRIFEFPVEPAMEYYGVIALKDKVILPSLDPIGMFSWRGKPIGLKLEIYDLIENRVEPYMTDIQGLAVSRKKKWMLFKSTKGEYTIRKAGEKPPEGKDNKPSRQTGGKVDTSKINIKVDLKQEWKQIFNEVWRMGKEFFWNEEMSGVDWEKVKAKYEPILDRLNTREELNDLLWEMQGELGTSHAYIFGGELQKTKGYKIGLLGADFEFDTSKSLYKVSRIYKGDTFSKDSFSPLLLPGINVEVGDYILLINGEEVDPKAHPYKHLLNYTGNEAVLTVSKTGKMDDAREVSVPTISSETPLIYRDWVNANINYVSKKTSNEVGYFHLPNMSTEGLMEFDRYFYQNLDKKGLVIDIRCNGGGFTSQYFLQKLYRRLVGFVNTRWHNKPETIPDCTFRGSIVVIIDENSGSDGDIFPRSFKNLNMGTVVGKRTWGGVVGISGSELNRTVDKGGSTQPQHAIWFIQQKYSVENYGVDPDVEVDNDPKSINEGKDNQLDVAIEEVKKLMDKQDFIEPDFGEIKKTAFEG